MAEENHSEEQNCYGEAIREGLGRKYHDGPRSLHPEEVRRHDAILMVGLISLSGQMENPFYLP